MCSRDGAVMRVLVFHQFGLGSILAWLSLLLVLALLQWFSWGSFSLLPLQEPTSPNSKYSMRGTRLTVWHIIIDLSKCCSLLFCLLQKLGVRVYIGIMVTIVVFHFVLLCCCSSVQQFDSFFSEVCFLFGEVWTSKKETRYLD